MLAFPFVHIQSEGTGKAKVGDLTIKVMLKVLCPRGLQC